MLKVLAGTGMCSASSAAQSIRLRRGVGKLRELHLQFCHLGSDGRDARRCFNHGRRLVFNLKWRLGDTRRCRLGLCCCRFVIRLTDARGTGLVAFGAGGNIEGSTILDLDASGLSVTDGGVVAPFA